MSVCPRASFGLVTRLIVAVRMWHLSVRMLDCAHVVMPLYLSPAPRCAQEVLEGMAGQYEKMKELCAALGDSERGKHSSLSVILQDLSERQAAKPGKEEFDRLKIEVRELDRRARFGS
jgi:hypothetical protein